MAVQAHSWNKELGLHDEVLLSRERKIRYQIFSFQCHRTFDVLLVQQVLLAAACQDLKIASISFGNCNLTCYQSVLLANGISPLPFRALSIITCLWVSVLMHHLPIAQNCLYTRAAMSMGWSLARNILWSISMGFRIRTKTRSQILGLQISFYSSWDQRKIEVWPQVFKAFPSFSATLALSAPNHFKFVSF